MFHRFQKPTVSVQVPWMDSQIFSDYARRLDAKFHIEGSKVALIIDNCPAHPNVNNLKTIELLLLPANKTSKTQPIDQGVIVRRSIKYIDAGRTAPKINILEVMRMLVRFRSWDAVSANTVKICFRKAGISEETQVASINDEDGPFKLLEENINELKSRDLVDGDLTVDDYVNIDLEVCTSETSAITDRDFILINDYFTRKKLTQHLIPKVYFFFIP